MSKAFAAQVRASCGITDPVPLMAWLAATTRISCPARSATTNSDDLHTLLKIGRWTWRAWRVDDEGKGHVSAGISPVRDGRLMTAVWSSAKSRRVPMPRAVTPFPGACCAQDRMAARDNLPRSPSFSASTRWVGWRLLMAANLVGKVTRRGYPTLPRICSMRHDEPRRSTAPLRASLRRRPLAEVRFGPWREALIGLMRHAAPPGWCMPALALANHRYPATTVVNPVATCVCAVLEGNLWPTTQRKSPRRPADYPPWIRNFCSATPCEAFACSWNTRRPRSGYALGWCARL